MHNVPVAARARKKTAVAMALLGLTAAGMAPWAQAQEGVLHGLGWATSRPGSELDAGSRAMVTGNRAPARVSASGGKGGAGLGLAGSLELVSTAQANTVGLDALQIRGSQVHVLQNQVQGFVNAVGGAATANTVLVSGGAARRPLTDSRIVVSGNTAGNVEAIGGKGSLAMGAIGSLQLPGRATANGVLVNESDLRRTQIAGTGNTAHDVQSVGGAALANATTLARSHAEDLNVTQSGNTARNVRAGGGTGGVGGGFVAQADLTGVATANTFTAAGSQVRGARITQQGNDANGLWAMGGSALANTMNLADYQGSDLRQYQAVQTGNKASTVEASGGSGSLLKGALADVQMSASALANAISVQSGSIEGATQHVLSGNTADTVQAVGGAAAANSIWLQDSTTRQSHLTVTGNTALHIDTAGGRATIGGGAVGAFERNGRALANSVALDHQSSLQNAPVTVSGNTSRNVQGAGGLASAGSLLMSNAQVQNTTVRIAGNNADGVRASGFSNSVGGGLLYASKQDAIALANSLGVFDSRVDASAVSISGNRASQLSAQGGMLNANSVSIEKGDGSGSTLSAAVTLSGNTANQVSTGASRSTGPGGVYSEESVARAATNAVVLKDGVQVDSASPLTVTGNTATQVGAVGGTALVNALAAYRGARIAGSPITLSGNRASDITTGGAYNQAVGLGSAKNGILVSNGVYLDGGDQGGVRLSAAPVTISGNGAQSLRADGGRINANALAINGNGSVDGTAMQITGNRATDVRSEGSEDTAFGHAWKNRGVGIASANAVQVLGALRASSLQLAGNTASGVSAEKGVAMANSVTVDDGASTDGSQTLISGNQADQVSTRDKKTALANSLYNEGRIAASNVNITGNQGGAQASSDDAAANSVRNRAGAGLSGSSVAIVGNRGQASQKGTVNSLDNQGQIAASQITVLGNNGNAQGGGTVNSVLNRSAIAGSQIQILGNHGSTRGAGTVNSVDNEGRIGGTQIAIVGNTGSATGGGVVNSVRNGRRGSIAGSNIAILGNHGTASGGGLVNSVDNQGVLSGRIAIMGNRGTATQGGTVNSVVNKGVLTGAVVIAGNDGRTVMGGTANSVINRGVISGTVTIAGNRSVAGMGATTGSVRTAGGVLAGAAGVTGNTPWAASAGYTVTAPSVGVVNRSVTVGPAVTVLNM